MKKKNTKQRTLQYSQHDIVHLAVLENEAILKRNFPNINYLHDVIDKKTGDRVVGIFVSDNKVAKFPHKVHVHLPNGTNHLVKTFIIKGLGKAMAHFANSPTAPISLSTATSYTGSVCCLLQDDDSKKYIFTSCHVLTDGSLDNPGIVTDDDDVVYNNDTVGKWYYGCMNTSGDYATVLLNDNFDIGDSELNFLKGIRDVNEVSDVNTVFHIKSQFNPGTQNVYFHGLALKKVSIGYEMGLSLVFDKIMLLNDSKVDTGRTLSKPGDSGGAVYDSNNMLVGIIVGGDDKFTYAIPAKSLIDGLKLKLI